MIRFEPEVWNVWQAVRYEDGEVVDDFDYRYTTGIPMVSLEEYKELAEEMIRLLKFLDAAGFDLNLVRRAYNV